MCKPQYLLPSTEQENNHVITGLTTRAVHGVNGGRKMVPQQSSSEMKRFIGKEQSFSFLYESYFLKILEL